MKKKGYWLLVLHAHLPYVRHPERPAYLEERWLFEALTECYIPLTASWLRLRDTGTAFRLTLSLSPPLAAMLTDPLLQDRYLRHLELLLQLAALEEKRTRLDPDFGPLAIMYRENLEQNREFFRDRWGCQMIKAWQSLALSGHLELWTSAATHAFLPYVTEAGWVPQIRTGLREHQRLFGQDPRGIWLPECAYVPGLEKVLAGEGLRFFVANTGAFNRAAPGPANVYQPLHLGNGVTVFGRDPETSQQVWDQQAGYPGDKDYRDFYRDIGYDLPYARVAPFLGSPERGDTGFKYYRITGDTDQKQPYRQERAKAKAAQHAADFVANRERQTAYWQGKTVRPPVVVSPYDAELFGHWWYEGPVFLENVLKQLAAPASPVGLTTPSHYVDDFGPGPAGRIFFSSWGAGGFGKMWLNPANDWVYRHVHQAEKEMAALATTIPAATGETGRILNQAARELMLAQASDWAFIMSTGTTVNYATERLREHLAAFWQLTRMVRRGKPDAAVLTTAEWRYPLFPDVDYRDFGLATASRLGERTAFTAGGEFKEPVWMLTWEYPPRIWGGLGRHVADLSKALAAGGVPVQVFTCGVPGSPEVEVIDGVQVHRLPVPGEPETDFLAWIWRFNACLAAGMAAASKAVRPAVIHAHDWLVAIAAKELDRLLAVPVIATIHATEAGRQQGLHNHLQRYIHGVETDLVTGAARVIVCSKFMAAEVRNLFKPPAGRIVTIPNGVNPVNVRFGQLTEVPDEEIILFIGRLVAEKGAGVLLEALPAILAARPRAKLVICGRGPLEQELRGKIAASGLADRTELTGFVPDETRNRLLARAAVAVFPSLYEPFGIVALEAMAAGLPVVVSDTGGLAEIIQHGVNGIKVPPGEAEALAGAVIQILADRDLARALANQARKDVATDYAWEVIAGKTAQVYRQVTGSIC